MAFLEIDPDHVPRIKLAIHTAQIAIGFVVWCLGIAVFRDADAKNVGNNIWTFCVFFLSIPAWIYLIMTPRFERTRSLAQPHAMLTVDALFAVIWLSAFSTQAAYNSAGLCGKVCGISKAIVALAVFVTLFWVGSVMISFFTLQHYNFHGSLPGYDQRKIKGGSSIDPDKAAFSMAPHDEEAYAPINMDERHDHHDEYASGAYAGASLGASGRPQPPTGYHEDDDPNNYGGLPARQDVTYTGETDYNAQQQGGLPAGRPYAPPTAHDYDDEVEHRPVQFPSGNYDRDLR